jgi:hypothetical protein
LQWGFGDGCKRGSIMRPLLHPKSLRARRTLSMACYGSPLAENSTFVVLAQQLGTAPQLNTICHPRPYGSATLAPAGSDHVTVQPVGLFSVTVTVDGGGNKERDPVVNFGAARSPYRISRLFGGLSYVPA